MNEEILKEIGRSYVDVRLHLIANDQQQSLKQREI
jgi:hypothetical protein